MPTIASLTDNQRRELLRDLVSNVLVPQRAKLLAYRAITNQSAQLADGYLAQMIASIVVGQPGTQRRGKTGAHAGDLMDSSEVKSSYRVDQKGAKEDAHINFGGMTAERMASFLDRDRCIIVHTSFDVLGRLKVEVLQLDFSLPVVALTATAAVVRTAGAALGAIATWHADRLLHGIAKPQLQARLYPDHQRDRLATGPTSLKVLGARLLARAVHTGDGVIVDRWSPDTGSPIEDALEVASPTSVASADWTIPDHSPETFFRDAWVGFVQAVHPFAEITGTTENVGFQQLAQHLVSLVTGIPGTDSNARGPDLADGGEVKLASGLRGNSLGTEDFPRLNLGRDQKRMLAWSSFFAVRLVSPKGQLAAKVLRADIDVLRAQIRDYFGPASKFANSENLQYHVQREFGINQFQGLAGDGTARILPMEVVGCVEERPDGTVVSCA